VWQPDSFRIRLNRRLTFNYGWDILKATAQEDNAAKGQAALKPQVTAAPKDSEQSKEPWYKTFQGWKTRLELIGILVAVGYGVVTYLEWRDLRRNFQAEQRSWIKIKLTPTKWSQDTPVDLPLTLTNIGKSPITYLQADGVVEFVDANSSPSFKMKQQHANLWQMDILFPSDYSKFDEFIFDPVTKQHNPPKPSEVDGFNTGKMYIATFGLIQYFDQFGMHWYRFCEWISSDTISVPIQFQSAGCVSWNRTGDGTPPNDILPK